MPLIVARGLIAVQPSAAVAIVGSKQDRCFRSLRAAEEDGQLINMMQMAMERRVHSPKNARIRRRFHICTSTNRPQSLSAGIPKLVGGGSDSPLPAKGSLEFEHDYGQVRESGPRFVSVWRNAARELGIDPKKHGLFASSSGERTHERTAGA